MRPCRITTPCCGPARVAVEYDMVVTHVALSATERIYAIPAMRLLLAILIMLAAFGCDDNVTWGPGGADFTAKLPHGYFIHRSSAHQIIVAPESWSDSVPTIPTKVVELDHDETWVIAKQQHLRRRSPDNPNDTYEEPVPGVFSYWILRLDAPQVWGPLSAPDFDAKRKETGVSTSLKLHDVYDYQPSSQVK